MPRFTDERIAEIRSHLTELKRSDCSVTEFARRIGVAAWTVYSWKRRFGSDEEIAPATSDTSSARSPELLEVRGFSADPCIEIEVADATVRIPPGTPGHVLRPILEALRSC